MWDIDHMYVCRHAAPQWYANTTDCGGDQVAAHKMLALELAPLDNVMYVWAPCFEHQGHLMSAGGLKLTDLLLKAHGIKWKYFSSIAKICHVWRDRAPKVFEIWNELFGAEDALAHAKKLIPAAKGGRWGSIEQIEKRLLEDK